MVMEARDDEYYDYLSGFSLDDESISPVFGQSPGLTNGSRFRDEHLDLGLLEIPNSGPKYSPCNSDMSSCLASQTDSPDEFSDCFIKFINQILVNEDMEAKQSMFHDPLALQATERSFYEALGEKYPDVSNIETPEENFSSFSEYSTYSNTSGSNTTDSHWSGGDSFEAKSSIIQTPSLEYPLLSSFGSTTSTHNNGMLDSMLHAHLVENIFSDTESILQFNRGLEEASKFLPPSKPLVIDLDQYNLPSNSKDTSTNDGIKKEIVETDNSFRGRKHYQIEDNGHEEERSSKQLAAYVDEDLLSEFFEKVVICTDLGDPSSSDSEELSHKQATKKNWKASQSYGYSSGWITRSWGGSSGELMDVRTLLVSCAQSVAADDRMKANEQLKQVRQHASPTGDAPQRLAHIFANGLEARLAGMGSQYYASKTAMTISAAEKLTAYQSYVSACPFEKTSTFFANKVIYDTAATSSTLHVVDFGIEYGFQWPSLIKHLSERPGGPPKLRITGIDLPNPGFRPTEGVEDTGRRLANYCAKHKVPFEYNAIAARNWETIKIEDLKLQRNECLAVNAGIRFKNLLDESVITDSPRDAVLKLIRDMRPDVFVHTIVNGSYSAPFFVTRFKEALFHFSSMFDMFDATMDRDDEQRLHFETEFCGREVMNVIACEGGERVERPETYKQWHVRLQRAGFKVNPLNRELVSKLRGKVKAGYHKDFAFDDDGKWLLHGWKGRILRANSSWVPV